jgi:hypothetical protein
MGEDQLTDAFGKVLQDLKIFAMPVFRSLARGEKLTQQWKAGSNLPLGTKMRYGRPAGVTMRARAADRLGRREARTAQAR